jgi:hypothetical protein
LIVAGTSGKLFEEEFTNIRNVLQVTHRRCYNVSGTSGELLEEDVATYHISGTFCNLLTEDVTT